MQRDLSFGQRNEDKVLPQICEVFGLEFDKTIGYDLFDYSAKLKKILIELKSRRVKKNAYPSTMIGYNKVKKGLDYIKQGYKIYFMFKFSDGLYFYEFKSINEEWCRQGGRTDRGRKEIKKYYYIPVELLINFQKKIMDIYISPTMSDPQPKTTKVEKKGPKQKLLALFESKDSDNFNFSEIETLINKFYADEFKEQLKKKSEMPFGKYKGKKIKDIARFDLRYLKWLDSQSFMEKYESTHEMIKKYV